MQAAQDVVAAASATLTAKSSSLRNFARVGALALGFSAGIIVASNELGARESMYKTALAARNAEIAELKAEKESLEKLNIESAEKPSSGDPVQDWIDGLAE